MPQLSYESYYVYNPGTLAAYYRKAFLRRHAVALAAVVAAGAAGLALAGRLPWLSGCLLGAAVASAWALGRAWASLQQVIAYYFEKSISLHVHDQGIAMKLPDFTSAWTWTAIQSLETRSDYLVFVRRGSDNPVLIPLSALTHEVVAFIVEHVRQAGGHLRPH